MGADGLMEKIRALDDTVASEVRDQVKSREDILRQVREAFCAFEQERIDREEGDALLKMQMEGCKHEIACEKEERGDAMNSLSLEIRVDTGKVKQQVDDLNHVLDLEAAKRAAADECNENRRSCKTHEAFTAGAGAGVSDSRRGILHDGERVGGFARHARCRGC